MNRVFANPKTTRETRTLTPRTQPSEISREEVERMLHDIAYVLQLTRRVKAEILEGSVLAPA